MTALAPDHRTAPEHAPPDLGIGGAPELVFQPAVDLATGRILGFEALLRWNVPGQGTIWPSDLIPWAEACGHMAALNAWVMSEACLQASRWPSQLQVAVNCSTLQLRQREAGAAAAAALELSGLDPGRLTVEVTETTLASQEAAAELKAIARMGVQLTVDDIGSACDVLHSLPSLAVQTMKIDGGLVKDLTNSDGRSRTIAETIVRLSRSLGICTVAECVESAAQVAVLRGLHVEVAQGHFFSPPLSADDTCRVANLDPPVDFLRDIATSAASENGAAHGPATISPPPSAVSVPGGHAAASDAAAADAVSGTAAAAGVRDARDDRLKQALDVLVQNLREMSQMIREHNEMLAACLDGRRPPDREPATR